MEKLTLSVPEAAKALGISKTKMYELARRSDFPSFAVGKRLLVSAPGLVKWVASQAGIEIQN